VFHSRLLVSDIRSEKTFSVSLEVSSYHTLVAVRVHGEKVCWPYAPSTILFTRNSGRGPPLYGDHNKYDLSCHREVRSFMSVPARKRNSRHNSAERAEGSLPLISEAVSFPWTGPLKEVTGIRSEMAVTLPVSEVFRFSNRLYLLPVAPRQRRRRGPSEGIVDRRGLLI